MTQPVSPKRRDKLKDIIEPPLTANSGLWFDRYLDAREAENATNNAKLAQQAAQIPEPPIYSEIFKRWRLQLDTMRVVVDNNEYRVIARPARAIGRIAIGLGDASVIETAVTLHQTYGVPYIPGSAIKGLASAYAHHFLEGDGWRKKGEYHTAMFGTTNSAGYVAFLDALYCPGTGHKNKVGVAQALWPDVITVHHPEYYVGANPKPPADWDSPTPVPFLTATGAYLIALGGPLAWVELGFKILEKALVAMGVGAKTSSGYGRMQFAESLSALASSSSNMGDATAVERPEPPRDAPSEQGSTPPPTSRSTPKAGQDLWGKVIGRRAGRWVVRLEVSGLEISATDRQAKGPVDYDTRVRVRVEKIQPLEGIIKDVRR